MYLRAYKLAASWLVILAILTSCTAGARPSFAPLPVAPSLVFPAPNLAESGRDIPTGQLLTPAGHQILLPKIRPQAMALSPRGDLLAVLGNAEVLTLLEPPDRPDPANRCPEFDH